MSFFSKMSHWNSYDIAIHGNVELLRIWHKGGYPWHENTTWGAARKGHKECLQYAHENGCIWDPDTVIAAACRDNVECLNIYEHCGITWENTQLETRINHFPETSKEYIKQVQEDWKKGPNIVGMRTKGAKK
jgi:hypothetical protein